jgi:hypothetical protein
LSLNNDIKGLRRRWALANIVDIHLQSVRRRVKILKRNCDRQNKLILRRFIRALSSAVVFATAALAYAAPTGYSVRSDVDQKLYRIDMATGVAVELGPTGFTKIEGLAINATGELFGVNPRTAQLVKCSTVNGACTAVGLLPNVFAGPTNAGLTFSSSGLLYLAISTVVYRVDPPSAGTVALNSSGPALSGLAGVAPSATCASGVYGMGGNTDQGKFYCINTTNGAATQLGTLATVTSLDSGLDGDMTTGLVWGITNDTPARVYAIDPTTLALSKQNTVTLAGNPIGGFESLAVVRSDLFSTAPGFEASPVPTLSGTILISLSLLLALAAALTRARIVAASASRRK